MNTTNPYAPPQAAVEDVAEPTAGELAGRLTRLGTLLLDTLILSALVYVPLTFGVVSRHAPLLLNGRINYGALIGSGSLLALPGLVIVIWLNVMFVSRNGQSIGKKIVGIKVVRSDGSRASLGRIFWLRNVIGAVLGLIPFVGMVFGTVDCLMIFGQARQCLHDKIADTIVIKA